MSVWMFSDPIRLSNYLLRNQPLRFLLCPERLIFLFSICSKTSQRNSIFIRYNKGAVREERKILPQDANAGNENRTPRQKTDAAAPFEKKHCPPLMRGNSQCGGQTTNHLLTAANVWEFSYTASAAFSSFPRRWLFLFGSRRHLSGRGLSDQRVQLRFL